MRPPKRSAASSNRPIDRLRLGDVAGDGSGAAAVSAGRSDRLVEQFPAAAGEHRRPAGGGERRRDRLADAGARAGDDGGLAVGHGLSPGRSLSRGDFRSGSAWQAPGVKKGGHWRPPNKDRMGGGDRPECLQDAPCSLTKAERGPAGPGKSLFLFAQRPTWRAAACGRQRHLPMAFRSARGPRRCAGRGNPRRRCPPGRAANCGRRPSAAAGRRGKA